MEFVSQIRTRLCFSFVFEDRQSGERVQSHRTRIHVDTDHIFNDMFKKLVKVPPSAIDIPKHPAQCAE